MRMGNLRMFCHVIETGSFSAAAEKHGVTPSSVSQSFAHMEKLWGCKLVVRGPHGISEATPAGKAAYGPASNILRLAGELHRALRRTRETADPHIRLAACHSIGLHQLPPFLHRFHARFPEIRIHLRYGLIDGVHHDVLENEADLGLACYPRRRPGLVVDLFRHERLLLVCHPEHPLAVRPAVALEELHGQTFVAWNEIRWSPFLNRIPDHRRHLFEPRHEFDQVEMVKGFVRLGDAVAILPESTVQSEVAERSLAALPFTDGGCTEPLGILYRRAKKLTPAMRTFIHELKETSSSPVGTGEDVRRTGEGCNPAD
jgi:DNA-binding transcriptional LysR family regulator